MLKLTMSDHFLFSHLLADRDWRFIGCFVAGVFLLEFFVLFCFVGDVNFWLNCGYAESLSEFW